MGPRQRLRAGYFAVPKLVFPGGLIIGDSANLFNTQKIKGLHLAMRSGMLAAETILDCLLADDFTESRLDQYQTAMSNSREMKDLYKARNFHQTMQRGLYRGLFVVGMQVPLGGRRLSVASCVTA